MIESALTRRALLAAGAAVTAAPALGQECAPPGPAPHDKGPAVFLDYDQAELDAAYDQDFYQPHTGQVNRRLAELSFRARERLGSPERVAYGATPAETLDIFRTSAPRAPVFVFLHGGVWQYLSARDAAYPAEMFVDAGAHYVAVEFANVRTVGGDLGVLGAQVRNAVAWVRHNAGSFGADPGRIYVGGHSSGGHLAAVVLVTDWESGFDLPADTVRGGLCISGMFDLAPVRLSWRRAFIDFTDEMEEAMSPQRHLGRLNAPVVVACGTLETPEFQRQSHDFAAAVEAAGKPVELVDALSHYHQDMAESLGNPYGVVGRAALSLMGLSRS
jgi:arylformamidase